MLPHVNKLNPNISRDVSAHSFKAYAEGKSFTRIGGKKNEQPTVRKTKVKPNDPCTCGSALKYKKCCGAA